MASKRTDDLERFWNANLKWTDFWGAHRNREYFTDNNARFVSSRIDALARVEQSRRYSQVISCKVGYETLAEEWRSRFGGRHFPKPEDRSGCAEKSPSRSVSPRRRDPRFGQRPTADRGTWDFGDLRIGHRFGSQPGSWRIYLLGARNAGRLPAGWVDPASRCVRISGRSHRLDSRPVASGACRRGEPGALREHDPARRNGGPG